MRTPTSNEPVDRDLSENNSTRQLRSPLRVDLLCTGLEHIKRGYESFARELFDAFQADPELEMRLFKGSGVSLEHEQAMFCFRRTSNVAKWLAIGTGRSSYHIEQWSFWLSYSLGPLRRSPPDIIMTSDANLAIAAHKWRKLFSGTYRIIFSNGGPVSPPFDFCDHVQQVARPYLLQALEFGEPADKHSLVPYGIKNPPKLVTYSEEDRRKSRVHLNLPLSRKIALSVGNISSGHKRMDYIVKELSQMPMALRPYLLLVGQQDTSSQEIHSLANSLLGEENFRIATAPYQDMGYYYASADIFVLASLNEGFGRVLLEATIAGLRCIVDDNPVMNYVLEDLGTYIDMRQTGKLSQALSIDSTWNDSTPEKANRKKQIAFRFSWEAIRNSYLQMFDSSISAKRTKEV